jgi:hypothetical protein
VLVDLPSTPPLFSAFSARATFLGCCGHRFIWLLSFTIGYGDSIQIRRRSGLRVRSSWVVVSASLSDGTTSCCLSLSRYGLRVAEFFIF